jgi:hypothetical protein
MSERVRLGHRQIARRGDAAPPKEVRDFHDAGGSKPERLQ